MAKNQSKTKDKGFTKNFILSLLIIIFVALLIWLFVTFWFTGADFVKAFQGKELASTLSMVGVIVFLMMALYGFAYYLIPHSKIKNLVLMCLIILISFIVCTVCADLINVYAMPISLCAVLLSVLINTKIAVAGNIILSQMLLVIFMIKMPFATTSMANLTASIFCNTMSGFVLLYLLTKNFNRIRFIIVGLVAGIVLAPFAAIVSLAMQASTKEILLNMLWVVCANVISVVLYMPLLPILESTFNVMTDFRLDELCSYSQPLLKKLSKEAKGTFNHSIIVGVLAESCAIAIGENPHLAKAGAYFHDVGKIRSPEFFIENQTDGYNPHDDLIPEVSVSMITKHTRNGAELIRKYHLPEELAIIASEHHGTSPVNFFYYKAQKITEGQLADKDYRYDGPKPSNKISAIIMICDIVEAAVRAVKPANGEEVEKLVEHLIKDKLDSGQFDDCDITMKDLTTIKNTIVDVMPSIHHARVKYKK